MITHVALKFQGKVWSLPCPYRHHHIIEMIAWLDSSVPTARSGDPVTYIDAHGEDQGFLDDSGKYLTRKEALVVATENNQLKEDTMGPELGELYSEDVW